MAEISGDTGRGHLPLICRRHSAEEAVAGAEIGASSRRRNRKLVARKYEITI